MTVEEFEVGDIIEVVEPPDGFGGPNVSGWVGATGPVLTVPFGVHVAFAGSWDKHPLYEVELRWASGHSEIHWMPAAIIRRV